MRAIDSRKLTALGYLLGIKLKIPGLRVMCLENQSGQKLLLASSLLFGPSWPQIHKSLEPFDSGPKLIMLGKTPAVIVVDSTEVRQALSSLVKIAKDSRDKQVYIEDVGFVSLDEKSKRDLRIFVLPAVSVVVVVGFGIIWGSSVSASTEADFKVAEAKCIVDLNQSEIDFWLSTSLASQPGFRKGQELEIQTDLARLNIFVENTIGSAAKVSGFAECEDGRKMLINHRVDTSGAGVVLELGK